MTASRHWLAASAGKIRSVSALPYDKWRDYDAEDKVGFYALRLHEAGMIKSLPAKLIADNTDWRFLNELKREMKVSAQSMLAPGATV